MTSVKSIKKGDKFWSFSKRLPEPKYGTVIALTTNSGKQIGLQFDEEIEGCHDCEGRGEKNRCLWVRPWTILTDAEYKAKLEATKTIDEMSKVEDIDELSL